MTEYFKVYEAVTEFDKRLLTVKGWGVTLSLAAIALGFEKGHIGLFLVAALSGAGFWAIEAVFKRHQVRFYLRMRDIEVACYGLFAEAGPEEIKVSSPLISWSWWMAPRFFSGKRSGPLPPPERLQSMPNYSLTWLYGAVVFPHVISVVAGVALFLLCWYDYLQISGL